MKPLLVVEDSPTHAMMVERIVGQAGFHSVVVPDGACGLQRLQQEPFSLVLTGLLCPNVSGLELIETVHTRYPRIPTVLLTGDNREEVAAEAMRLGVTGYVPKQNMQTDLVRTLQTILELPETVRKAPATVDPYWKHTTVCYTLDNSPELVPLLVEQMRRLLDVWQCEDENEVVRVGVALGEALDNALYHGNLELSSELRQGNGAAWRHECRRRRIISPYKERRIRFEARISPTKAKFSIRDEGQGFNPDCLLNPTDPVNLERCCGRGLLLMRMFVDEVSYNALGNEVTLLKSRPIY